MPKGDKMEIQYSPKQIEDQNRLKQILKQIEEETEREYPPKPYLRLNYCQLCKKKIEIKGFCSRVCSDRYIVTDEEIQLAKTRWMITTNHKHKVRHIKKTFKITLKEYLELTIDCSICGFSEMVHIHHIQHKQDGGKDELSNYIGLCYNCHFTHHAKGLSLSELRLKYGDIYKK